MKPRCTSAAIAALALLSPVVLADPGPVSTGNAWQQETPTLREERELAKPGDAAADFGLAQSLARSGEHERALAIYEHLQDGHPDNVDYLFGRAQVLSWLGRYHEANEVLERALVLAPDYEDLWNLSLSVATRVPRNDAQVEARRRAAAEKFPESTWWLQHGEDDMVYWMLQVGAGHESLSGNRPDWRNQFMTLTWHRDSNIRAYAGLSNNERFDRSDTQYVAGLGARLTNRWTGGVEIQVVKEPVILPGRLFSAHAGRQFGRGWGLEFRFKQRWYDAVTVSSHDLFIERYFGDFRAAYTLSHARLHGEASSFSNVAAFNWYVSEKTSTGISVASGTEAEIVGPGEVLETDFAAFTFSLRQRLTDRLALDCWAGTHQQGDFYRRRYVGIAVSLRL